VSPRVESIDLGAARGLPWRLARKNRHRVLASVPALASYLRDRRPDVLLAAGNYVNAAALVARRLARTGTPVVISQNSQFSLETERKPLIRWAARHLYPAADAIIAVSHGVAQDLAQHVPAPASRFHSIYNPTVRPDHEKRTQTPVAHPWFLLDAPPVVLGVGRLHGQKDFPTLIRAFARVRREHTARLVILGDAKQDHPRQRLCALAEEIGIADDVDLPGFAPDAVPYMARAGVFVLSSRYEGFPNALVEALASGCPAVATRCPSGPEEILDEGRFGALVAVGDVAGMANAISEALETPPDRERLRRRGHEFDVAHATDAYLDVLLTCAQRASDRSGD
jgi:glycosyltransferase involved in cell wall biosynthesis